MLGYYLHDLNPLIFQLWPGAGPRWYGFAYLLGFMAAYVLLLKLQRDGRLRMPKAKVADLVLNCCIFGVLVGGRLGHVFFYEPSLLWDFRESLPFWGVLEVWRGGMSAHGGVVGVVLTLIIFARRNRLSLVNIGDAACMVVPLGMLFGRIANFINGELYGRVSGVPWAVKFPSEIAAPTNGVETVNATLVDNLKRSVGQYLGTGYEQLTTGQARAFVEQHADLARAIKQRMGVANWGDLAQVAEIKRIVGQYAAQNFDRITGGELVGWLQTGPAGLRGLLHDGFANILPARHPSQLYEAALEGLLLFLICWGVGRWWKKDGMAGGAFLTLYPVMRIIGEQFRVGDEPPAWLAWTRLSSGVIYSLPMLAIGLAWWVYWARKPALPTAAKAGGPS